MAEVRIGRGWSRAEIALRLKRLDGLERSFDEPPDSLGDRPGWRYYASEGILGVEAPGPAEPDGPFERARAAVTGYAFSDPGIVKAAFDPHTPLLGRRMLLQIRVLALRYLCGVVVGAVRDEVTADRALYGFRYDTLQGHIECGAEWFLLSKHIATGDIHFRIQAHWREGEFPNWWSHLGFHIIAPHYQKRWHRQARLRLSRILRLQDPGTGQPWSEGRRVIEPNGQGSMAPYNELEECG